MSPVRWHLLLLGAVACGSAPPPTGAAPMTAASTPAVRPAAPATAGDEDWNCDGKLVPPNGWEQFTAFHDASRSDAREAAWNEAATDLVGRLCGHEGGCDFLRARVRNWKTGTNGKDVCAMAVISSDDLVAWRTTTTLAKLDELLAAAARQLVGPGGARVAIDQIRDMGLPGGARAEWLRARMERQLGNLASLTSVRPGWAGDGVPPGLDVVVHGDLVERSDNQVNVVESSWSSLDRNGARRRSEPVVFPAAPAPVFVGRPITTPSDSDGLSLRVDSRRAGSLCEGEQSQLWVHSDEDATVRVFDLYGDDEALLIYPNAEERRGRLGAGQTIPLAGPRGFEAVPAEGTADEEFLVVAGPEARLGAMRSLQGPCRLPPEVARALHRGGQIPEGTKVAWTGYRILSGPDAGCQVADPARRSAATRALASIPTCSW
jgi:hypothetical protein